MKKISLFILSVLLPLLSSAANSTLSIEPLTIGAGETKTMLIDLSNPDQQVTMVEFRMQLPQGLSIAAGDNAFDIAGRTNWQKHTLYSNEKDGLIHVMLASPTNALVSGTSGALISVRLTASSTFSGGTITLKNQKIGSPDMTVSKPADYSYSVQASTPQPTEAEPYVVYNNGTLTFYCDNQRSSRVGETYDLNTGSNIPGWFAVNKSVTKAVFDASFANARPTTTNDWFCNCKNLTEIKDISNLNTNDVTSMDGMFDHCYNLTSLDVSNFNTTKVTNMNRMFYSCEGLTSLDVSKFNTSNVTNMSWMFSCCKGLTNLNVSNFNTEKVTNMEGLFDNCEGLTKLDVSNFNTEKVTNMAYMFRSCYELTSLNMSNFNTEKVTTMCQMFESCRSLTRLDVSTFNTEKVTDFSKMFYNCQNLSSLVMNNHFVSKEETKVEYMFTMINDLKKIQYTGDIPSSIHSKFFAGVGTAENPATLDVPAEYRDHYAAKFDDNKFFGGYFKLSGAATEPLLAVDAKVLNAVDGIVYSDYLYLYQKWTNTGDDTFTGTAGYSFSVYENNRWTGLRGDGFGYTLKSGASAGLLTAKCYDFEDGKYKIEWWYKAEGSEEKVVAYSTIVELRSHDSWKAVVMDRSGIMTYSDEDDLDFSSVYGLKAYTAGGFNTATGEALMMRVNDVPAGTGLLLTGEPWYCYLVPRNTSSTIYVNMLKGVIGSSERVEAVSDGYKNYYFANGSRRFNAISEKGTSIDKNDAYLQVPAQAAGSRETITLKFDDTSGIGEVSCAEGEPFDVYTVSGQVVKRGVTSLKGLPAGIYIADGRKVVVR